jgi:hypothetical protein
MLSGWLAALCGDPAPAPRRCRCGAPVDLPEALRADFSIAVYCSADCLPAPTLGRVDVARIDATRRIA